MLNNAIENRQNWLQCGGTESLGPKNCQETGLHWHSKSKAHNVTVMLKQSYVLYTSVLKQSCTLHTWYKSSIKKTLIQRSRRETRLLMLSVVSIITTKTVRHITDQLHVPAAAAAAAVVLSQLYLWTGKLCSWPGPPPPHTCHQCCQLLTVKSS